MRLEPPGCRNHGGDSPLPRSPSHRHAEAFVADMPRAGPGGNRPPTGGVTRITEGENGGR